MGNVGGEVQGAGRQKDWGQGRDEAGERIKCPSSIGESQKPIHALKYEAV